MKNNFSVHLRSVFQPELSLKNSQVDPRKSENDPKKKAKLKLKRRTLQKPNKFTYNDFF